MNLYHIDEDKWNPRINRNATKVKVNECVRKFLEQNSDFGLSLESSTTIDEK